MSRPTPAASSASSAKAMSTSPGKVLFRGMEVHDFLAQLDDVVARLKAGEHTFNDCSAVFGGRPPPGAHVKTLRLRGPSGADEWPSPRPVSRRRSRGVETRARPTHWSRERLLRVLRRLVGGRFGALPMGGQIPVLHYICTT